MLHPKRLFTMLPAILLVLASYGQDSIVKKDTAVRELPALLVVDSMGKLNQFDSARVERTADTGMTTLVMRIGEYTEQLNKANSVLKRDFDTLQITGKLEEFENNVKLIDLFIESKTGVSNQRSFSLSKILLTQMERQLKQWQGILTRYRNLLVENNKLFNSIGSDSILKALPSDSVLRLQYFSQIEVLSEKWVEADTVNKVILYRIAYLQNRVSMSYLKVVDMLDIVNTRMKSYSMQIFREEFGSLFGTGKKDLYDSSVKESFRKALRSNSRVFIYYSNAHLFVPLIFIIGGILFYFWIRRAVRRIRNTNDSEMKIAQSKFLVKYPLTSTLIVTFTLAPFMYANPPMLYTELLMFVTLMSISLFAWQNWEKKAKELWFTLLLLFIYYSGINLMVTTTFVERIIFLLVSAYAIWFGIVVRKYLQTTSSGIKKVGDLICFMFILLQGISVIANILGRYSLAKICSITATFGLTQGFVIYYFIDILLETIFLELESHRNQSGLYSYFDFKDLGRKMRSWLIGFGILLWTTFTLKNLNVYDYFYSILSDFLLQSRKLGNTHFTFWSIVVFLIVLMLATFLSRIVGYIFGNPHGSIQGISKGKIGSGVLLIRLGIYTIGIIIAFVASGIPVDKLTIIIGALGVGIGFGLQNVVNNLVSGVILAFEKPIQIGDVVEIGTRMGVVNEIGIRSSKISTYEGSTVIIPNGDLIAQHIVNWTHENTSRRIEVLVGVAYGSDVNTCQDLIEAVIHSNKQVINYPKPAILLERFGNSSVDFRVLFWTGDIANWVQTKSEIMTAIYKKFEEKGIQIPFPQQDLHIRSIDPDVAKSFQKEK